MSLRAHISNATKFKLQIKSGSTPGPTPPTPHLHCLRQKWLHCFEHQTCLRRLRLNFLQMCAHLNPQESLFHKKNAETFESTATPAPKLELEAPPGEKHRNWWTEWQALALRINSIQSACSKQAGTSRCTWSTSWRKEAQLLQQSRP